MRKKNRMSKIIKKYPLKIQYLKIKEKRASHKAHLNNKMVIKKIKRSLNLKKRIQRNETYILRLKVFIYKRK